MAGGIPPLFFGKSVEAVEKPRDMKSLFISLIKRVRNSMKTKSKECRIT